MAGGNFCGSALLFTSVLMVTKSKNFHTCTIAKCKSVYKNLAITVIVNSLVAERKKLKKLDEDGDIVCVIRERV